MTKWNDETVKALFEAVEWATPERFKAKGERWGAVAAMVFSKTGVYYLGRTCRAKYERVMQQRQAEHSHQSSLELPESTKHLTDLTREMGLLFGELVAMREEMKELGRAIGGKNVSR